MKDRAEKMKEGMKDGEGDNLCEGDMCHESRASRCVLTVINTILTVK